MKSPAMKLAMKSLFKKTKTGKPGKAIQAQQNKSAATARKSTSSTQPEATKSALSAPLGATPPAGTPQVQWKRISGWVLVGPNVEQLMWWVVGNEGGTNRKTSKSGTRKAKGNSKGK